MRRFRSLIFIPLLLASCATEPSAIKAVPVAEGPFQALDCAGLEAERVRIAREYEAASAHQKRVNSTAPMEVLFFELKMMNALDKSKERDIARLKGEYDAVERQRAAKACAPSSTPSLPD